MATCRKCIHWDKCSKVDGITRFYGKEMACNNAEKLCEWFISTANVAPIADTAKKTLDAVRSRATRNAYSCMISGNIRETYTISGKALEEIEKELLEE